MPNIELELTHLAQADRHIALARDNLAAAEALAIGKPRPQDPEDRLNTLREALAAFEGHRAIIVKTIEDLRDGSLPDRTEG